MRLQSLGVPLHDRGVGGVLDPGGGAGIHLLAVGPPTPAQMAHLVPGVELLNWLVVRLRRPRSRPHLPLQHDPLVAKANSLGCRSLHQPQPQLRPVCVCSPSAQLFSSIERTNGGCPCWVLGRREWFCDRSWLFDSRWACGIVGVIGPFADAQQAPIGSSRFLVLYRPSSPSSRFSTPVFYVYALRQRLSAERPGSGFPLGEEKLTQLTDHTWD